VGGQQWPQGHGAPEPRSAPHHQLPSAYPAAAALGPPPADR
jgi:hypothetical protein